MLLIHIPPEPLLVAQTFVLLLSMSYLQSIVTIVETQHQELFYRTLGIRSFEIQHNSEQCEVHYPVLFDSNMGWLQGFLLVH